MLLYGYQKTIMDILKTLGAARVNQIKALVKGAFPDHFKQDKAFVDVGTQIEQMVCHGELRRCGNIILYSGGEEDIDADLLAAVDVMLQLSGGMGLHLYRRGDPPAKLTFFREREDKLIRYDICCLDGSEHYLTACFSGPADKYRTLIFITADASLRRRLPVETDHCYAVRGRGHQYHFYK